MTAGWRINLKWLSALLACGFLAITLITAGLVRLTSKPTAVRLISTILAVTFSPRGLDDEEGLEAVRQQLEAGRTLRPFSGSPVAGCWVRWM